MNYKRLQNKNAEENISIYQRYLLNDILFNDKGAGIAQLVYRLATGWTTERSEFKFRWGQEFSLHVVQTGPRVQPNLLYNGYRGLLRGAKAAGA
jgi:hypothetical protein